MGIYEIIGAIILWALGGFRGKALVKLEQADNPKLAYLGLCFVILSLAIAIALIRIFFI